MQDSRCPIRLNCPFYKQNKDSKELINKGLIEIFCKEYGEWGECKIYNWFKENKNFDIDKLEP